MCVCVCVEGQVNSLPSVAILWFHSNSTHIRREAILRLMSETLTVTLPNRKENTRNTNNGLIQKEIQEIHNFINK